MNWAEAASGDASEYISQIVQWGPPGIVIVLILTGILVTKSQFELIREDRDSWRSAYEKERDGHDATRAGLVDSVRAASASLEVAKTTTQLLTQLGHVASSRESGS